MSSQELFTNYTGKKSIKTRLVLEGIVGGIAASLLTALYRLLIDWADSLRNWIITQVQGDLSYLLFWLAALVIGGLIITWSIRFEPMSSGSGIPQVKGLVLGYFDASWIKVIFAKFIGGIVAIIGGMSLGREGPSIQLGSSAAVGVGKTINNSQSQERVLLTCGASAGLAAAFNAPLAGLIFSLEEIHKNFSGIILISTLSACVVADFISKYFFGIAPVLNFTGLKALPLSYYPYIIPLGILLGVVGLVFNQSLTRTQDLIHKPKLPDWFKTILIMLVVGLTGLWLPEALGGGHHLIMNLINYDSLKFLMIVLIVKFVLTMISYGSNAPGGIFLPLLSIGALVGCIYSNVLVQWFGFPSIYVTNLIILAMAGVFTAIVRAPVTGIILIVEMTGSFNILLPVLTICLVAFFTAELLEYEPIYDTLLQRLLQKSKGITIPYGSKKDILEFTVCVGSFIEGKYLKELELPQDVLVVNIARGDKNITPRGSFRFRVGDTLAVLCNKNELKIIREKMEQLVEY